MPKESYAKIWTTVGMLTLYTSLNMYLYIQGSELAFGYPDFSKVGRQSVSLYAMLIFIPSYLVFLWITFDFLREYSSINKWSEGFPVAFNLKLEPTSRPGKKYQTFFFILFFIIPITLQVHSLKKFFQTPVFLRTNPEVVIANNFKSHLLNFQSFSNSFGNEYRFGDATNDPVTFFPGYQSWAFLLLEVLIFYLLIRFFVKIFGKRQLLKMYLKNSK